MVSFIHTFHNAIVLAAVFCWLVSAGDVFAECPEFEAGYSTGTIESPDIDEASGLAASRKNPYVLWTHNDKGGFARVFAMNIDGSHLGNYYLSGASNRDWEDIAVGPGPDDGLDYIYVGDIGDNDSQYTSIKVYRVPEPQVDSEQSPVTIILTGVETITLQYPDGPRDAETLMVDPVTKDIYIISKRDSFSRVYRAPYPQSTTTTTTMEYKCELPWDRAAGGDISLGGDKIIVRTGDGGIDIASIWLRPEGTNLWNAFSGSECSVQLLSEGNGEAICFVNGFACGFITTSEGDHQPIHYYPRIFEADFDESCRVDFKDFSLLASAWLTGIGDEYFNPDYDISETSADFIDEHDLAVFVDSWLAER